MRHQDVIERSTAYHARPVSTDSEIWKNIEAERIALQEGNEREAEASRTRVRRLKHTRTKSSGKKKLALARVSKRDPLSRVSQTLRRAGEILRDHSVSPSLPSSCPDGVFVDGSSVGGGMEGIIDRRARGERAWRRALDSIKDEDFRMPIYKVIVFHHSLAWAAQAAKGHQGGKARAKAKVSLEEALTDAAYYFGLIEGEGLDRGAEVHEETP